MNRALILMYHMVDEPESSKELRFCTPPKEFRRQMAYLEGSAFIPITLEQLVSGMNGQSTLPENPICITFDDGFESVLTHALPVLNQYQMPATLFAVSDLIGKTNIWMHKRAFPRRNILTWPQLRELDDAGVTIGSHTRTHVRLTEIPKSSMIDEISNSKKQLEDALGKSVDYFAYPYGLYDQEAITTVVDAGYSAACSTLSGFNRGDQDIFQLRRIDIFGTDQLWKFRQKLQFGINKTNWLFPGKYYLGRLKSRLGLSGNN